MRIQHNIMAMSAYRNYNNNTAALSKNLEKLSSGYKINRAGDDAAGLAISEKMRAQITGLDAAQKNVKDGISLVKTAEGAMQEIQDMLNRMDYLATQSANGTYDNEVDRAALQKEVEQLKSEINRIADSANFNGIKLLDGSLDTNSKGKVLGAGVDRMLQDITGTSVETDVGVKTILDGANVDAAKTKFSLDFSGLTAKTPEGGKIGTGGTAGPKNSDGAAADTFALNTDNLKAAIEGDANYDAGDFTADTDVKVEYNGTDSKWYISAGANVKIEATATFDAATNKLTLKDANNNELMSITAASNKGGALAAFDFEGAYGTAVNTGAQYNGTAALEVDVTMEGASILSAPVSVNDGDTAEDIAKAVLAQLDNDNGGDGTGTEVDVNWNGANYKVTVDGNKLVFDLQDDPTAANIKGDFDWDVEGAVTGTHTAGTTVETAGAVASKGTVANTVFRIDAADIKDGTTITLDGKTVTLAVGKDSTIDTTKENVVNLKDMEAADADGNGSTIDLDAALGRIANAIGDTTNFVVGVNNTGNGDTHQGITVAKKIDGEDASKETYDTKEKLGAVFSINAASAGKPLTLQIGDTSDDYNKLAVNVGDMHTSAMGIASLDIGTQEGASAAIQTIRNAINYVSGVRGDLGATQNRLEHTQNNLSVMAENIQDAESTIRDTDVAEEMMSYVKNNILVQSAQAMLAQANQVPQGVLQLLG